MKIFDCVTFYQENFITNIRFEILDKVVDHFIICESKFDHSGNKKKLNFQLRNKKFKDKVTYLILKEPFPKKNNAWQNQAQQREYIFKGLNYAKPDDYVMFSDPDEIPNPKILKNFSLKKNLGFFYKNHFVINSISIINLKVLGKEQEFVKKKIFTQLTICVKK